MHEEDCIMEDRRWYHKREGVIHEEDFMEGRIDA